MADLLDALPISRDDKIGSLRRELRLRRRVYPHWVATGKMTEDESKREIAVMEAILADYENGRV